MLSVGLRRSENIVTGADMFGLKKRIWQKQLKRAATIENCLLAGLFDHLMASNGYDAQKNEPTDEEGSLMAGTAQWILGIGIEKQLEMCDDEKVATERIQTSANELLQSDEMLEQLTIRLLYEIASLSMMLRKDAWAQEYAGKHIRIMEILSAARPKWPELFRDVDEALFKKLFTRYLDIYMPDMRASASQLFQ